VDIGAHLIADRDIPPPLSMGETFQALAAAGLISADLSERLRKAVGLRNLAVHSYAALDWAVVHAVCRTRLGDFRDFGRAVAVVLEQPAG
jgi:uncharacterized protein YutE (UPF0331/DUF86 family)